MSRIDPLFERYGYKVVQNAYDMENHRDGLRDLFKYAKALPDSDPDEGSPGSPAYYNDIEIRKLLIRLMPLVERSTGLSVYPTYGYMRRYGSNGVLERHRDRNACEISCTVCIGFDGERGWPIWVKDYEGTEHEVCQMPGDLLIYRGIDLEHWREPADHRIIC